MLYCTLLLDLFSSSVRILIGVNFIPLGVSVLLLLYHGISSLIEKLVVISLQFGDDVRTRIVPVLLCSIPRWIYHNSDSIKHYLS